MPLLAFLAIVLVISAPTRKGLAQNELRPTTQPFRQQSFIRDNYKADMLIRTTLIALSQANLTGNYTVLRDLGSPTFQASVSASDLAESFADLRHKKYDFSPILFFSPNLTNQPTIDETGRLRLTGFIETRPEQINFDMLFETFNGEWRLAGLLVQMQEVSLETASVGRFAPANLSALELEEPTKTSARAN